MPRFLILSLAAAVLASCSKPAAITYSYSNQGYYYKLEAFDNKKCDVPRHIAWLAASFSTQDDSVFWDSDNNFNDRYLLELSNTSGCINHFVAGSCEGDSVCLLVPAGRFCQEQFGSNPPAFCEGDTVIKARIRIKKFIDRTAYEKMSDDLEKEEAKRIHDYVSSRNHVIRYPEGFYAINDSIGRTPRMADGEVALINYRGSFLNGRVFDRSPAVFEYVHGMPDQVLKGLNYVIPYLTPGRSVRIMLPSWLAYGSAGSSTGAVPPFTPIIYEIKLLGTRKPSS